MAAIEPVGVKFTKAQPSVRLAMVAAAHSVEPANALKPTVAANQSTAKPPREPRRSDSYRAVWLRRPLRCLDCRLSWPVIDENSDGAGVRLLC